MSLSLDSYDLFGLTVSTELDLDLPPSERRGQIQVLSGSVLEEGEPLFRTNDPLPFACYRQGEAVVLSWTGIRFRVVAEHVVIDANDVAAAVQLLVPAVWSVVLSAHQRESLHGAAVAHDGRAMAIMGQSGSGKTTAAHGLIKRGWQLISDDLLTFDTGLRVVPGPPWMRILPSSRGTRFGDTDAGGKIRVYPPTSSDSVPLSAIVVMAPEHERCVRLSGVSAATALLKQVYNPVVTHSGQTERRFELVHDLVDHVPVYGVPPRSLSASQLIHMSKEAIA